MVVEGMEARDDGRSGTLEERVEGREEVRDDGGSGILEERVEEREEVRDDDGSGTLENGMKQNVDLAARKPQPPSDEGSLRLPGWVTSHFRAGLIVYLRRT